ncbi:MAG: 3-deoxy-7-phosphoheptulonate synthase [Bryobacterales bacterium]|nr:3-deoxy-7-phosphoheptulonate synthase [Bryobacterales bacterium]
MWSPESWKSKPARQQVVYPDQDKLNAVVDELGTLPPLVTSWEIVALRALLAEASQGHRFVLQGGDCAERFADCQPPKIANQLKILLQMSLVLVQGSQRPVIRVGRFAGQYAKPRSEDFEERGGERLLSYRGDLVNRSPFTAADRQPDPQRLLRAYERSALTLNFCRALVKGGFADLHHPEYWDLGFARQSPLEDEYQEMVAEISRALRFMENVLGVRAGETDRIDFYTSHEALHLPYEQAQTKQVPHRSGWFNLGVHFPWIGVRTALPDEAHVEYCRGIENPVGIKAGPATTREQLLALIERLNPRNEPGKLAVIHRLGRRQSESVLPRLIEWAREAGANLLWICDPMHGNTRLTSDGIKTRNFDDILGELELAFTIHAGMRSYLGGVHIELTGENVTECVGGARGLSEADLKRAYVSEVDPRLNYEQALEIALCIARKMRATPAGPTPASP